jgi:LL-diaminopimelate aminotransferase
MKVDIADRVKAIPPYLFAHIDKMKQEAQASGMDVLDFGIGDPDVPTPQFIIEALGRAAARPANHRYPAYPGSLETRKACADFYAKRFDVTLDPKTEVLTLIGSKEGIAHLPLALINPGDLALVPDPAYPVYASTIKFVGGEVYRYRLRADHEFVPDLASIPEEIARRAKVIYFNYPNNPTGGVATIADLQAIEDFAQKHELICVSDLAYSEVFYEEPRPPSFLQLSGARSHSIEFYSLSKTYNMTGWRIGFAVGEPSLLAALGKIKTNMDSGVFGAVQEAAVAAMSGDQSCVAEMRRIYLERRDLLSAALRKVGLSVRPPRATFYFFAGLLAGTKSMDFCGRLLRETGIVCTPGVGFGEGGEGFVRFSLSVPTERIREAATRLAKFKL